MALRRAFEEWRGLYTLEAPPPRLEGRELYPVKFPARQMENGLPRKSSLEKP